MTIDTLKQAAQALRKLERIVAHHLQAAPGICDELAAALEAMAGQEPAAHMYPSDLDKFQTTETFAHAYSVAVGCPGENTVPLYRVPIAIPEHDAKVRDAEPDMFWNAADPERFGGENLHDAVLYAADDICVGDLPAELTFQSAKRLPDVRVRITGYVDEEWQYEIIDDTKSTGAGHAK